MGLFSQNSRKFFLLEVVHAFVSSTCALLEELIAESAIMEARGEEEQSKGETLALMLRL